MSKIFYLTDTVVQLIDVGKLADGKDYVENEILWQEKEQIEALLLTLDGKAAFSVIFDFVDESITHEWVLKLMPWEKQSFEKQIKDKFYDDGGLFVRINWLSEHRKNQNGASEELMMTSSVVGDGNLDDFFTIIEGAQLSIQAIHSYSFLLEKYFLTHLSSSLGLAKNKLKQPFLLVLQETRYKYRQIFFLHGKLRISRIVEIEQDLEMDRALTIGVANESFATVKYLYNQKIVPFNSPVGLIYLSTSEQVNTDIINEFSAVASFSVEEEKNVISVSADLYELEKKSISKGHQNGLIGFLSEFSQKNSTGSFYQNEFLSKLKLFKNYRLLLVLAIFFTVLLGSFFLVSIGVTGLILKEKISAMDVKIKQYQSEKNTLQDAISLTYDAQDIKASVDFSESILDIKKEKLFENSLQGLSNVLSKQPHIIMDKLLWKKNQYFDNNKAEIYLEGWVFPFDESYEEPVSWVDDFVESLQKQAGFIKVEAIKEPLDRNLKKAISISVDDIEQINALPFSIKLIMRSTDDKSK